MTAKRKRDREATRERLLEVARLRFARDGYDATSVRDIAGDADVDATLIFRYFGSKKRLFDEASAPGEAPAGLLDGPPDELVARMMREVVFHDWSSYAGEHPLLAMLKSAGHEDTRQRIRQEVRDTYVAALAGLAEGPDAQLRAGAAQRLAGRGRHPALRGRHPGPHRSRRRRPGPARGSGGDGPARPPDVRVATGLLGRPMSGWRGLARSRWPGGDARPPDVPARTARRGAPGGPRAGTGPAPQLEPRHADDVPELPAVSPWLVAAVRRQRRPALREARAGSAAARSGPVPEDHHAVVARAGQQVRRKG